MPRSSPALDLRPTAPPRPEERVVPADAGELVAFMRATLSKVDRSASAIRRIATSLDRYEHAIARWHALPPSPAQREALLDQLRALEEELAVAVLTAPAAPPSPSAPPAPVSGPASRSEAITQRLDVDEDFI